MLATLTTLREGFASDPDAAMAASTEPIGPLSDGMVAAEAAAWSVLCSVILNLDETLTKE